MKIELWTSSPHHPSNRGYTTVRSWDNEKFEDDDDLSVSIGSERSFENGMHTEAPLMFVHWNLKHDIGIHFFDRNESRIDHFLSLKKEGDDKKIERFIKSLVFSYIDVSHMTKIVKASFESGIAQGRMNLQRKLQKLING